MRWPLKFSLQAIDIGPTDMRRIAFILFILLVATIGLLTALVFEKQQVGPQGERGEQGLPGPAGPSGTVGPAGPAGVNISPIRFVDGECRQACALSCEYNERILSIQPINPGGTVSYEDAGHAIFRPQNQKTAVKVVVACVSK